MAKSLGERLKAHWLAQGLTVRPGVSNIAIADFEAREVVRLPSDFRLYFQDVNPLGRYFTDGEGFSFWSFEDLTPVNWEWSDRPDVERFERYFLFADKLINCPSYAIRLLNAEEGLNRIVAIYSDNWDLESYVVADSFTEFVEKYLKEGIFM